MAICPSGSVHDAEFSRRLDVWRWTITAGQGGFDAARLLGIPREDPAGDHPAPGSGHRFGGLFSHVGMDERVKLSAAQVGLIQQCGTGQGIQHCPGLCTAGPQDGGG